MQESLIVSINGREAIPVRAIPYVAGRSYLSPSEVAKQLARRVGTPFARLKNTTAFHLSGQSPIPVSPKEWDETVAKFGALKSKLKREQPTDDEGYAEWLEQTTALLPSGVFVWCDEFEKDFHHDVETILPAARREGDDILNYSPLLSARQREMILAGRPFSRIPSSAPAPISPSTDPHQRASAKKPKAHDAIDWPHWRLLKTKQVKAWEAVFLSFGINPYDNEIDMRDFEYHPDGNAREIIKRLRLLDGYLRDRNFFSPPNIVTGDQKYQPFILGEVANWCVLLRFPYLPPEFKKLAQKPDEQEKSPAGQSNKEEKAVQPNWIMRVQQEAARRWIALRTSGANPTKNSIKTDLANWCREKDVTTDRSIFPSADYIYRHVLRNWNPPS